jgi:hypothetical protein
MTDNIIQYESIKKVYILYIIDGQQLCSSLV